MWPEEDFPLQPVGELTLNRNIDNFHNESEQIAFSPAVTIGGSTPNSRKSGLGGCIGSITPEVVVTLNDLPGMFGRADEAVTRMSLLRAQSAAGIGLSNDKVLQTRALSYSDTQRYRIGTNYQMLPINAPKCPFHNSAENGPQPCSIVSFLRRIVESDCIPHAHCASCLVVRGLSAFLYILCCPDFARWCPNNTICNFWLEWAHEEGLEGPL